MRGWPSAILSVSLSLAAAAPAVAACRLAKIAQMPLTPLGKHYAVMAKINDVARPMIVDTGSEVTVLAATAAKALGLAPDKDTPPRAVIGIGQTTGDAQPNVVVPTLALGDLVFRDRSTVVATMDSGDGPEKGAAGLLGDDILSQFDVEFDFPGQTLTFYRAIGCYSTFLPWTGDYTAAPFQHRKAKIAIDVVLNGERTRAIVDTGNDLSLISRSAPALWGVPSAAFGKTIGRSQSPLNRGPAMPVKSFAFDEFQIGGELLVDRAMGVVDVDFPLGSANIGLDFWASRKIWISYAANWMFIADRPSSATLAYPVVDGAAADARLASDATARRPGSARLRR